MGEPTPYTRLLLDEWTLAYLQGTSVQDVSHQPTQHLETTIENNHFSHPPLLVFFPSLQVGVVNPSLPARSL